MAKINTRARRLVMIGFRSNLGVPSRLSVAGSKILLLTIAESAEALTMIMEVHAASPPKKMTPGKN
ncbi:MAG: Uncharacterised protein [Cryomorphaceae bacterium]|nr:MAG: Uncharacterised protein [Cryomorphaceae bacterium]